MPPRHSTNEMFVISGTAETKWNTLNPLVDSVKAVCTPEVVWFLHMGNFLCFSSHKIVNTKNHNSKFVLNWSVGLCGSKEMHTEVNFSATQDVGLK